MRIVHGIPNAKHTLRISNTYSYSLQQLLQERATVLCYVMLCYVMLCYVMLCYTYIAALVDMYSLYRYRLFKD